MAVKLRLQRHGKKGKPYYWIVAADSRSKRDGRFLEKIGTYNPNLNPAEINLRHDDAVKWIENGAQPTNTVRAILSYKGVLLKLHLKKGVAKGALTQEQADEKFDAWSKEKQEKIQRKAERLAKTKKDHASAIKQKEKSESEKANIQEQQDEISDGQSIENEQKNPLENSKSEGIESSENQSDDKLKDS